MRAVVCDGKGDRTVLRVTELPDPTPKKDELLVDVKAAGINRADILQRRGLYPPPPGASEILGLEIAGTVAEMGESCTKFRKGDRVFGLVEGGGYSSRCTIKEAMAIATPENWDDRFAAAIPEVFFTAHETLFSTGGLQRGEEVLIHAGGSGVGSTAIQMARQTGASIATTASSHEKLTHCSQLGADLCINYKEQDFVTEILPWSKGGGVHLVLDFVGAAYLNKHLKALRPLGRMVSIGLLGGARAELNLGLLLTKRLQIKGSVMRNLSLSDKVSIKARFMENWMPRLCDKSIKPVIFKDFSVEDVCKAHETMETNKHFGKMILTFV